MKNHYPHKDWENPSNSSSEKGHRVWMGETNEWEGAMEWELGQQFTARSGASGCIDKVLWLHKWKWLNLETTDEHQHQTTKEKFQRIQLQNFPSKHIEAKVSLKINERNWGSYLLPNIHQIVVRTKAPFNIVIYEQHMFIYIAFDFV